MAKIVKFGEVIITDKDILIQKFSFDCKDEDGTGTCGNKATIESTKIAIKETINRLEEEYRKITK